MILRFLNNILYWSIKYPIEVLYFRGPGFNGFGFWEGIEKIDICSRLTNVDSQLWLSNTEACDNIIQRKLESIYVALFFVVYVRTLCSVTYIVSRKIKEFLIR
jgi:hypothetical protein